MLCCIAPNLFGCEKEMRNESGDYTVFFFILLVLIKKVQKGHMSACPEMEISSHNFVE